MLVLVTGGSGSGKSAYAEERAYLLEQENLVYIATMFPYDKESDKRIERHQKMRADKHFRTIECYVDLLQAEVTPKDTVLLECMSNLVANEVFMENGAGENTVETVRKGIRALLERCNNLIVVTNELFSDGAEYDTDTSRYLKYLGQINRETAEIADEVVEIVYSIPVIQKCRESRGNTQ